MIENVYLVLLLLGAVALLCFVFVGKRRKVPVLKRKAKPVLYVNWVTAGELGKMVVVVWAKDFYEFAFTQYKSGARDLFYAPLNSPAAVFTENGYMPDACPATGTLEMYEKIIKGMGDKVKVETCSYLFFPRLNSQFKDTSWQEENCGIVSPSDATRFFRKFFQMNE